MTFIRPDAPEAAEFQKQVEAANRRFGGAEVCHSRRRPLKSGELNWIGTSRKRSHLMVVAGCCRHMLKVLVGFGVWYAERDVPASWLDRIEPRGRA